MQRRFTLLIAGLVAGMLVSRGSASAAGLAGGSAEPRQRPVPAERGQGEGERAVRLVVTNKGAKAASSRARILARREGRARGQDGQRADPRAEAGSYAFFDDFNQASTGRIVAE
jgi:hypothetical protein